MKPTILIDRREQRPWAFPADTFDVQPATLATGDYSLAGLQDRVAIERKNLGDAVGTVIHDWLRFRKELNRLKTFDFAAIVIEADLSDVVEQRYESEANPNSVIGRFNSILIDDGIPVLWWGSRKYCEPAVARLFLMLAKRFAAEAVRDAA